MKLVASNDGSVATFEFNVPQKAVLSATLQLRKSEGQVDPSVSLGKAVISNLQQFCDHYDEAGYLCATVLVESNDSSENLKALFDSKVPSKLRGVKLTGAVCKYIEEVSQAFVGEWVIKDGVRVVHQFKFDKSPEVQACQTVGTTLYQLVKTRFKTVTENDSLALKARGSHLKAGDYANLTFWVLALRNQTSGVAFRYDLTLNFIDWTVYGTVKETVLEHDRVRDMEQSMSEDLDIDDDYQIDDYDDREW